MNLPTRLIRKQTFMIARGKEWSCTYCYNFKWITNKDLLYSIWNSAQYYVAAWMGG